MKKFTIVLMLLVSIISCENRTAKSSSAFREDLMSKTIEEQTSMMLEMSPEQLCDYWTIKLENTLASKNVTSDEKLLISPLLEMLSDKVYMADTEESVAFKKKIEEVSKQLTDKYKWTPKKLFKYFETIMTEEEFDEYCRRNDIDLETF